MTVLNNVTMTLSKAEAPNGVSHLMSPSAREGISRARSLHFAPSMCGVWAPSDQWEISLYREGDILCHECQEVLNNITRMYKVPSIDYLGPKVQYVISPENEVVSTAGMSRFVPNVKYVRKSRHFIQEFNSTLSSRLYSLVRVEDATDSSDNIVLTYAKLNQDDFERYCRAYRVETPLKKDRSGSDVLKVEVYWRDTDALVVGDFHNKRSVFRPAYEWLRYYEEAEFRIHTWLQEYGSIGVRTARNESRLFLQDLTKDGEWELKMTSMNAARHLRVIAQMCREGTMRDSGYFHLNGISSMKLKLYTYNPKKEEENGKVSRNETETTS